MNRYLAFALALFAFLPAPSLADDQAVINQCIAAWGPKSPFKKGALPEQVIGTGVKVFGLGSSQSGHDAPTERPSLVLVRSAVNVAGKSTIRLSNPKGWYCFEDTVTVMGKTSIVAHCNAQLAGAKGDGTAVMAANDANQGVAVMGALRVSRFGCSKK